jgi:hypothetical protein
VGYGILAKNPEAECVDDLSIWTQKNTFMPIANDDCKNKAVFIFWHVVFLRFLKSNFVIVSKILLISSIL